jgi:hypothetical protein
MVRERCLVPLAKDQANPGAILRAIGSKDFFLGAAAQRFRPRTTFLSSLLTLNHLGTLPHAGSPNTPLKEVQG